ncbi:hypothetical protein ACJZ2D_011183 [Fusarium nematophilum]
MPYNTTAIPPRKEPTGQTQLPLSRVKKIIAQDPDIGICSNNAAFVITLAAEMFVQHLAKESHNQAKLDRKPPNAVSHQDNLEFLEDVVPKTVPYKKIKAAALATQARLRGENAAQVPDAAKPNGTGKALVNGNSGGFTSTPRADGKQGGPGAQRELEMRQAPGESHDGDVNMTS